METLHGQMNDLNEFIYVLQENKKKLEEKQSNLKTKKAKDKKQIEINEIQQEIKNAEAKQERVQNRIKQIELKEEEKEPSEIEEGEIKGRGKIKDQIEESKKKIEELKKKSEEELKKFFEKGTYLNPKTYDTPDEKDVGTKEEVWNGTKKYYASDTKSGFTEYRSKDMLIRTRGGITGIVDMLKSVKEPEWNKIYSRLEFTDEPDEERKKRAFEEEKQEEETPEEKPDEKPPIPSPKTRRRRIQGPPPAPPPIPPPPLLEEQPEEKPKLEIDLLERLPPKKPPKKKPSQIQPPVQPSQAPRTRPKRITQGPPPPPPPPLEEEKTPIKEMKKPFKTVAKTMGTGSTMDYNQVKKSLGTVKASIKSMLPKKKVKASEDEVYPIDDKEDEMDYKHDLENAQGDMDIWLGDDDDDEILFQVNEGKYSTELKYNPDFFDNRPQSITYAKPANVRMEDVSENLRNDDEKKQEKEQRDANYYEILRERLKNQQNKEAAAREAYFNGMSYSLQQEHYDEKALEEKREEFMRNVQESERLMREFMEAYNEDEEGLEAEYNYLNEEGREEPLESRWSRFRRNLLNDQRRGYNLQAIQQYMRENAIRSKAKISELSSTSIANIAEGLGIVQSSIQDFSNRYGVQLELFNELREWGLVDSMLRHPQIQNTMIGRGLSELNRQTMGKGNLTDLQNKFVNIMDAIISGGKVIGGDVDFADVLKISKGARSTVDIGKGVKSIVDSIRKTKDDDKEGKDDNKDDKKDLVSELQNKGIIYQKLTKPAGIGKEITPYKFPNPYERRDANKLIQNAVNNFLRDRNMYGNYYGNDI